jgi:hypothetical protein
MNGQLETWNELCATFSVKDHTLPGAFIAEVLLYDRLIIPIPPRIRDGVTKEEADQEWNRWKSKGWDPARQTQLIAILKHNLEDDRIIEAPWTSHLQTEWRKSMTKPDKDIPETLHAAVEADLNHARHHGYVLTGHILQQFAPAMAKTVVAVSTFRSLKDLMQRTPIQRAPPKRVDAQSLMAVLGFELFVPNDSDSNDFDLLSEAAAVAADATYRRKRTALYLWQQQFIRNGLTDELSVKTAVNRMGELVEDLNKETKWKWAKKVLSFFKAGKDVAELVNPAAKSVGPFLSVGDYIMDQALGDKESDILGKPAAALVLDVQKRLGLKRPKNGRVSLKSSKR